MSWDKVLIVAAGNASIAASLGANTVYLFIPAEKNKKIKTHYLVYHCMIKMSNGITL